VATSPAPTNGGTVTDDDLSDDVNIFLQRNCRGSVDRNHVLLDSQSMTNLFVNPSLLANIRPAARPIKVFRNAGDTSSDTVGNVGSMEVYYHRTGIANVLSLHEMAKRHHITYDSRDRRGVFIVHTPTGNVEFKPSKKGLHYLDLATDKHQVEHMLVNTVAGNFEGFTKKEVAQAHAARRLQGMLGSPSEWDFNGMVREKLIVNCPVTSTDVQRAHQIFGPDLAGLRGKTSRRDPAPVQTEYVEILQDFLAAHRNVTLTADVVFINGLPFLITLSRRINLVTMEFATNRRAPTLASLLRRVVDIYALAGLKIQTAMMDMEFDCLKPLLPQIVINTTAANEHVSEIEHRI
jgi:hypothetical protein